MTTDSDIVRLSLARPSEFAALFDRHAVAVGHYARRLVGVDAGDDVLSETFLVAFRRRADYDLTRDSALPWLLGIATRLAHKARAAEARRWRALQASAALAVETAVSDIDAAAERADAVSRLRRLVPRIRRLSAADRDTLLLHAWGDLSTEQIAAALDVPVGTVWSRLNRIRRRLRADGITTRPDSEEDSDGLASLRA
ncbi:RNA polymerase sigma factor [Microbacterium marinilacus]|uniref:RNA polymerase sigma factor n=1 Tax=Microbacterium marinilacus TaxID=415209 RepID=A0ABP7B8L7_9MICO|nr:RNA polymerase sigma factor [Microbacterium marinilacus]MBY0687244.1 RNA polymerase sigma factor [Microbacterium marinilacus]